MYLPVLLVRDYGPVGWLVFAAPNVIGAAAMGWVLNKPESAVALARKHWHAGAAFSLVTILFHAFFIGWVARQLVGDAAELIVAGAVAGLYLFGRKGRRDLAAAGGVLAISLIAFAVAISLPAESRSLGPVGAANDASLIWLAPVCIFGFLLCPYLDLTFLRARASTASLAGVAAFTIGFGVMFLGMILFTLWYAPMVQPTGLRLVPRALAWALAIHMILQTAFTIAVHARAISPDPATKRPGFIAAFAAAVALAFFIGIWGERIPWGGRSTGEGVYRLFLAFYGLLFPAYVWLCMIPARGKSGPTRQKLAVLGIAVLLAAPFYWLGFMDGKMIWLVPGLAIVLVSRVVIASKHSDNRGTMLVQGER